MRYTPKEVDRKKMILFRKIAKSAKEINYTENPGYITCTFDQLLVELGKSPKPRFLKNLRK